MESRNRSRGSLFPAGCAEGADFCPGIAVFFRTVVSRWVAGQFSRSRCESLGTGGESVGGLQMGKEVRVALHGTPGGSACQRTE